MYVYIFLFSLRRHLLMEAPFSIKGLIRKNGVSCPDLESTFSRNGLQTKFNSNKKTATISILFEKKKHVEDWVEIHIPNRDLMVFNSLVPSGNLALHFVGSFYSDV